MENLGEFLKEARVKAGLTLRAAAEVSGVNNAHISQIEGGKIQQPSVQLLMALSDAYDVSTNQVLRIAKHLDSGRESEILEAAKEDLDISTWSRALLVLVNSFVRRSGMFFGKKITVKRRQGMGRYTISAVTESKIIFEWLE
jgi:transcriptional regulator with XRE-family HTH domain